MGINSVEAVVSIADVTGLSWDAMQLQLHSGAQVARSGWPDGEFVYLGTGPIPVIRYSTGAEASYVESDLDTLATDWLVL